MLSGLCTSGTANAHRSKISTMSLLVLSATDVDRVVAKFTPTELVDLMAKVFIDLSLSSRDGAASGKSVSIPHRSTVSSPNHNTLFMPSRLAPLAGTAIKVVSVPTAKAPSEIKARGLPASTLVLDEQTGEIAAVVNARKLTALRNAASVYSFPVAANFVELMILQVPCWPVPSSSQVPRRA